MSAKIKGNPEKSGKKVWEKRGIAFGETVGGSDGQTVLLKIQGGRGFETMYILRKPRDTVGVQKQKRECERVPIT